MSLVKFQLTQSENAFFFCCCLFVFSGSRFCRRHIFTAASVASGGHRKKTKWKEMWSRMRPTNTDRSSGLAWQRRRRRRCSKPTLDGNLIVVDFNAEKKSPPLRRHHVHRQLWIRSRFFSLVENKIKNIIFGGTSSSREESVRSLGSRLDPEAQ